MKKGLTLLLCLMLLVPAGITVQAEETEEPSAMDIAAGILSMPTPKPDPVLDLSEHEETQEGAGISMEASKFDELMGADIDPDGPMPEARYVGIAQTNLSIRAEMSKEAAAVGYYSEGDRAYVVDYEPNWLLVVKGDEDSWVCGYVPRHTVSDFTTYKAGELPYGTTPATYSAIIGQDTMLHTEPLEDSEAFFTLTKGTKVAILEIENGWAKVIYWRRYAYFYLDNIESLTPVYGVDTAESGDTISAFISFYNLSPDGLNPNRIINIAKACEYISIPLEPGMEFSFNGIAGPYRYNRGYLDGMSYFEGEAVPSVGGGTCQVSSTLYNVLLPLEEGITIVHRRAHGPAGASYLPHGVDAAVGNVTLDLIFRNDYDFPVRIEASSQDGVLYIAMLRE